MLRAVNEESAEETRKLAVIKSAINTLSYSEMEAVVHIFLKNWTVWKESSLPARLQTVWELPDR